MHRFIVYWDYRRKDQLLPFERLSGDYEWYYIFFRYKKDDPVVSLGNRLYWSDYKSPYALLHSINPDGIIFSDLSSLYAISLNIAAKNKKIITFLLEHGIKLEYDHYLKTEEYSKRYLKKTKALQGKRFEKVNSFLFYIRSFRIKNFRSFHKFIKLLYTLSLKKSDNAFFKSKFSLRCPDKYLLFSRQNLLYYQQRDGISLNDVIYFGNPYLDDYAKRSDSINTYTEMPYFLLLDDGQIETLGIRLDQKNEFIKKLNEFCKLKRSGLMIKLHPFDYGRTDLYQDTNITYLESTDIASLIVNSTGCFAISTSLMFPLIITGKVIVFKVPESKIQDALARFGVRFLDYLNFDPANIDFDSFQLRNENKEEFIEQFLYKNDGKALQRLKMILEN